MQAHLNITPADARLAARALRARAATLSADPAKRETADSLSRVSRELDAAAHAAAAGEAGRPA